VSIQEGCEKVAIDEKTSLRMQLVRFPLIVGVVYGHNYETNIHMAQGTVGVTHNIGWVHFIMFYVFGVARVCIPLFFMISGYLFFTGVWSWKKYAYKLNKRVSTLLIPMLFWNLAAIGVYAAAESIPQTKKYFAFTDWPPVHAFRLFDYINALLGVGTKYPIAYQFWFIRDLMALALLAPVVNYLLRGRFALPFLVSLLCFWFFCYWPAPWPIAESCFFFSLGAYLSQPGKDPCYLDRFGPWMVAMFMVSILPYAVLENNPPIWDNVMNLLGAPSVWWLTRFVARNEALKSSLLKLGGCSFFVYAAHEPLLKIVRKVSYRLLMPTSGAAVTALFFLIPIILIIFLVATYYGLLKTAPSFVGFITGRSGSEHHRTPAVGNVSGTIVTDANLQPVP
jgi:fucose 4-O-acetylase-like acetyltransferase